MIKANITGYQEVLEKAVQQNDPFRVYLKSSPEIPEGFDSFNVK